MLGRFQKHGMAARPEAVRRFSNLLGHDLLPQDQVLGQDGEEAQLSPTSSEPQPICRRPTRATGSPFLCSRQPDDIRRDTEKISQTRRPECSSSNRDRPGLRAEPNSLAVQL